MPDNIVEMTAQQFRAKLQEMVRLEIAKRLSESDEGERPANDSNKEDAVTKAKAEILRRLQNAVIYTDKINGTKKDETPQFLDFIKDLAGKTSKESLMGVSSLEDLAGRLAVNFSTSEDWDKAKKEAEDLTTKYIVSKGEKKATAKKETMAANKEFKGKEEEILHAIADKLKPFRNSKGTQAANVAGFTSWLKKNYPNVVDQSDDPVSAFTKYASYFSQPTIPANKSPMGDLNAFLASSRVPAGIDKTLSAISGEEEADKINAAPDAEAQKSGDYTTTVDLSGETLQSIGNELGVSPNAIEDILKAIPPGKVKAIEDAIRSQLRSGKAADAKRNLETYSQFSKRAVSVALREFIKLIDKAIDESDGELMPTDLIAVVSDLRNYKDPQGQMRSHLSPDEEAKEDMFLSKIVDIVNDPEYANEDEWQNVVGEMLKMDYDTKTKMKTNAAGNVVKVSGNIVKTFQNMVSKALGMLDPGSRAFGKGRPSADVAAAKAAQQAEFPPEYRIGTINKQQRAGTAAPTPGGEPGAEPAKRGRKPKVTA